MTTTLLQAMRRIEKQTRGYDSMSTMGILNEIACAAIAQSAADLPESAWLQDSYSPPDEAIRAGGNCIGAAELQAMASEELHPDDIALRIWYAMRPAIANQMSQVKP
jgi:hypothetical protein